MNYTKTKTDYLDELHEQLDLLIDYCNQFDQGKLHYAKPMASALRVLVHDGKNDKSLFLLLESKKTMKFCSTSKLYRNYEDIIYLATLITPARKPIIKNGNINDYELKFVPNLSRNINPKNWINFDDWYNLPVFIHNKDKEDGLIMLEQKPGSKLIVNRSKIINYFRNKDGGGHVDPKVNSDMYNLSKSLSSIAYQDIKPLHTYKLGEKYVPAIPFQNSLHAALRQIAHEIILTIRKEFGLKISYNPSHKIMIGYKIEQAFDTCVRFDPVTRQVSTTN